MSNKNSSLVINHRDGMARTGVLTIGERSAPTPFFMPVATKGTVKHMTFKQLSQTDTKNIIMNAFLLSLRPGADLVEEAGGLHKFTLFDGMIATDSGGFQVLSPTFVADMSDEGVYFRNPYTGQVQLFRPEDAVEIQQQLGSDIAMVLDDQPAYSLDKEVIERAVTRTLDWAQRSIHRHRTTSSSVNPHQLLFVIGQGGVFTDIRTSCAERLAALDADGYAVGGLAIGEPPQKMYEAILAQTSLYPEDKMRYVMGLGSPLDIIEAVMRGADMFDSIFPTQNARRGSLFTSSGLLRITNKRYREDFSLVDAANPVLAGVTRAYLHHLLRVEEAAGLQLATLQNLWFMQWFMSEIRLHIEQGRLASFKEDFGRRWRANDSDV